MNATRKINLKANTTLFAVSTIRGVSNPRLELPAGTEVTYERIETHSGVYHTVWTLIKGVRYEASKKD